MSKQQRSRSKVKPAEVVAPTENVEMTTKPALDPTANGEIPQVGANEVLTAENDLAVKQAAGEQIGEQAKPAVANTKESKKAASDHKEVVNDLVDGKVTISDSKSAYDTAVAMRPLVPHPVTGKPVAETADQSYITQSVSGDLVTPKK